MRSGSTGGTGQRALRAEGGRAIAPAPVDAKGNVLCFRGDTGAFLAQPAGEPTRDLLAVYPLTDALQHRGAPFAFLTGYGKRDIPVAHRDGSSNPA